MRKPLWNPYLVGLGIGLLSWFSFITADEALGASTTFVRWAGMISALFAPDHVAANEYYQSKGLALNWQMMLVVGLLLGAWAAARLAARTEAEHVPGLWRWRFGPSCAKRYLWAFVGGVIVAFGARMAGGCTSGHGVSGGLQLAVSSWLFIVAMFLGGIVAAFTLFGKEGRNHVDG